MVTHKIRTLSESDIQAIADIYSYYVKNDSSTFEMEVPSIEEMAGRLQAIVNKGLPFLVSEKDGEVTGYAYAAPYRTRQGYRYTLEESVYIKHGFHGKGFGKALLDKLIAECKVLGYKQLLAVITKENGCEDNVASIKLHSSCGFEECGHLKNVGYKFDKWFDTIIMQKTLKI